MAGTDSRTSKEVAQPLPAPPRPGHTGSGKVTEMETQTCGYKWAAPNPATLLARSRKRKLSSAVTGMATRAPCSLCPDEWSCGWLAPNHLKTNASI